MNLVDLLKGLASNLIFGPGVEGQRFLASLVRHGSSYTGMDHGVFHGGQDVVVPQILSCRLGQGPGCPDGHGVGNGSG